MTITCPNCKTTYHLADDRARPGVKLRCTVCKEVFPLPAAVSPTTLADGPAGPLPGEDSGGLQINIGNERSQRRKSGVSRVALVVMLLFIAALAATWKFTPWLDPLKGLLVRQMPQEISEAERAARLAELIKPLEMRGVRQYTIPNEKIGKITVIEGKVANGADTPRELIRLEASLFDSAGNTLATKSQLAGTVISLFQLQVLDKEELERALNNKLDILSNNTNVPPGGQVPFMIVLYNPPEEATDFSLRVTDARLPAPSAQEGERSS